jgi:hypothetical protein
MAGVNFAKRGGKKTKPAFLHSAVKIRARKNLQASIYRAPICRGAVFQNKKPGNAGLFDELHFRSVHFASLAI